VLVAVTLALMNGNQAVRLEHVFVDPVAQLGREVEEAWHHGRWWMMSLLAVLLEVHHV